MQKPVQSDAQLALQLNIDPALVTRYKKRGMPTHSLAAADAWRRANVRPRMTRPKAGTAAAARNALHTIERNAQLWHAAAVAGRFELVRAEVQQALQAVPASHEAKVRLSRETFDALLSDVMAATAADRRPGAFEAQCVPAQEAAAGLLYRLAATPRPAGQAADGQGQ